VKSEEYLEKIFDINFHMPLQYDLKKLLKYYFLPGHVGIIEKYLKSINFTNPRHLKKVFNKFLILQFIKNKGIDSEKLIPKIKNGNTLNEIFVLHFIILFEFYKDVFYELKDLDKRMNQMTYNHYNDLIRSVSSSKSQNNFPEEREKIRQYVPTGNEIMESFLEKHIFKILKALHLILTIPNKPMQVGVNEDLGPKSTKKYLEYLDNFTSKENIQVNFAKFILNNQSNLKSVNMNYQYNNLFKMAEKYHNRNTFLEKFWM